MAWICHEFKMTPSDYKRLKLREQRALANYLYEIYKKDGDD